MVEHQTRELEVKVLNQGTNFKFVFTYQFDLKNIYYAAFMTTRGKK